MTKKGWEDCIIQCVRDYDEGNRSQLEFLIQVLYEQDEARALMVKKGLRITGQSLLEAVKEL